MWSYMMISDERDMEITSSVQARPFLENLAHPLRCLPELERRHAGGTVEGADEIGEVAEAYVIGDIGHRLVVFGEQPRGTTQSRAHQILMRGHPEHACEQSQEMKRADPGLAGNVLQRNIEVRMSLDPERRLDRPPPIPRLDVHRLAPLARDDLGQAM